MLGLERLKYRRSIVGKRQSRLKMISLAYLRSLVQFAQVLVGLRLAMV